MAKRLSKTLWYGTGLDTYGKPLLPPVATNESDLNGLHRGELFMHLDKEEVTLWALSSNNEVVQIAGKQGEIDIDLSDYLLKSVWDKVWELRRDNNGVEYIYSKLPVVTRYGITMYADNGEVEVESIYEGLPIDRQTLIWKDGVLMVNPELDLGGGGGIDEDGLRDYLTRNDYAKKSDITTALSGYATTSSLNAVSTKLNDFLEGSDTDTVINKWKELETFLSGLTESDNLATILTGKADKSYVDTNFVTIAGTEDVTGLHNFVNGLKVGGIELIQKNGNAFLKGNLVVEGGITMYGDGEGGSSVPLYSTLGSLLNVDESNDAVANVDRVLFQSAGSNVWSWKALSEIGGGSSGGGSVSGDYLPLSGGTLTGYLNVHYNHGIAISSLTATNSSGLAWNSAANVSLRLRSSNNAMVLSIGGTQNSRVGLIQVGHQDYKYASNLGTLYLNKLGGGVYIGENLALHEGNYSSYALPLSGGTINGAGDYLYVPLFVNALNNQISGITFKTNGTERGHVGYHYELGMRLHTASTAGIAISNSDVPIFYTGNGSVKNTILHSGNYSSYALPKSGGTMTGGVVIAPSASYTTAITDNCTVLKLGSDTSGMNGYNSGLGFNALQRYSSAYPMHLHAWIGLSPCINSAGSELYDLVFATNGSTTVNTSPVERLRITNDGSVKIQKLFFGNTNEINSTDGSFLCLNYEGTGGILMSNNGQGVIVSSGWSGLSSTIQQRLKQCMFSVRGGIFSYMDNVISNAAAFVFDKPGAHFTGIGSNGETDTIYFGAVDTSNLYSWASYSQIWKFGGSIITTGGITMYSDARKKTILNNVELSLKDIANAPLIEHYYNSDQEKTTHVGSIAQYWVGLNDWFCKKDAEGYYTMEIQNCALASAISIARHLERYESKTDNIIRKMKQRIQELEDKLEKLEGGNHGC